MRTTRLLAATTAAALLAASAASATAKPLHVLFLGDSLTHGVHATTPAKAFPQLVTAALARSGTVVPTVNGVPGVITSYWKASAVPTDTDVAVVELGTNDVYHRTPLAKFDTVYRHTMAMVHARAPHAKIVCVSVWWPPAISGPSDEYNQLIEKDCTGQYVNIIRFAHPPNLSSVDHFHPNDSGHRLIAQVVTAAIRSATS